MGAYCRNDGDVQRDIDASTTGFPISAARRSMPASVLSGGEQQMLAISRALLARPKLMMLDEPSLGLSPLLVERLFELIASCAPKASPSCSSSRIRTWRSKSPSRGLVWNSARSCSKDRLPSLRHSDRLAAAYLGHA